MSRITGSPVAVAPGQIVEVECEDDNCEDEVVWNENKSTLEVKIVMRLTATDASGKVTVCVATPKGLAPDNDDDHDPADDDD